MEPVATPLLGKWFRRVLSHSLDSYENFGSSTWLKDVSLLDDIVEIL